MKEMLRFIFGMQEAVGSKAYFLTGVVLMLLKYFVDAAVVYLIMGKFFSPFAYLSPLLLTKTSIFKNYEFLLLGMGLWTLIFVWIGVSMSIRRLKDAGKSPWFVLFFFIPLINYIAMLVFASLPTAEKGVLASPEDRSGKGVLLSAFVGTMIGAGLAVVMALLAASVLRKYGLALFFGTPFVMGFSSVAFFNRQRRKSISLSLVVAILSVFIGGGLMLLFALEGGSLYCDGCTYFHYSGIDGSYFRLWAFRRFTYNSACGNIVFLASACNIRTQMGDTPSRSGYKY